MKMIKVPCITEFQHEWIRKETARYMFIEKEGKCTCSCCNKTVEVGRTKHRGKVTCPSCGKELQTIHLWRLRSLDVIDWVVIPRTLNETTLMLRYVLAARHNESVTITELARMVIDFSTNKDYCFENINGEWVKSTRYYFKRVPMGNIWGQRELCCLPAKLYRQTWVRELNKLRNVKIRGNRGFDDKNWEPDFKAYMVYRDAQLYEKLEKVGLSALAEEDMKAIMYSCLSYRPRHIKYNGKETSLLKMLGINRTALRYLQERPTLEMLSIVRKYDLSPAEFDLVKERNISESNLKEIAEYGLKQTLHYLAKGVDLASWMYYVSLLKRLGYTLDTVVLYPKNFEEANRIVGAEYEAAEKRRMAKEDEKANKKMKKIADGLRQATWLREFFEGSEGLQVVVPETAEELRAEGRKNRLDNCLGHYVDNVSGGKTLVFFVRKVENPTAPYVAMEYKDGRIRQCMFKGNHKVTDTKIINFVEAIATRLREHNILAA